MSWPRDVFATMGTVVSLEVRGGDDAIFAVVRDIFASMDETYSLYKPESELSRLAEKRLRLPDASEDVRMLYAAALEWRSATSGDFTANRPDGVIDLSGIVKAVAMQRAADQLGLAGFDDWCLNAGGDVLVSGLGEEGGAWLVGVVDPAARDALLTSVALRSPRSACATSGSVERGDHIWTDSGRPADFVQVTVVANDILTADVMATAIVSGGVPALDRACVTWDIDVLAIDRDGGLRATPRFRSGSVEKS